MNIHIKLAFIILSFITLYSCENSCNIKISNLVNTEFYGDTLLKGKNVFGIEIKAESINFKFLIGKVNRYIDEKELELELNLSVYYRDYSTGNRKVDIYSVRSIDSIDYYIYKLSWQDNKCKDNNKKGVYLINPTTGEIYNVYNNYLIRKKLDIDSFNSLIQAFNSLNYPSDNKFNKDAQYNLTLLGKEQLGTYHWNSRSDCDVDVAKIINSFIKVVK